MKNFDKSYLSDKVKFIAGVDEAGRGPLAGPVVAAAVIFPDNIFIDGVNDSKQLSEKERERLLPEIISKAICVGVASVSHGVIDTINILQSSLLAMKIAVGRMEQNPDLILVDGNKSFNSAIPVLTIVKGDSKSFSIAAASIVAKVTRDRIMKRLSVYYPLYLWENNKGYASRYHINAIKKYGASPLHRKTFLTRILNPFQQNIIEVENESR
ncbi:MAG: ribonuclease HII [Ignavibacteriales bacterium]|nr:ribonuclease HII [Ignavibacteriales bacterium]